MARTSLGTWEERLEELRRQADPEMDQLVHRYYQDHQELEDVRSLVLQMLSELGEAKRNPTAEPATTAGQAGDRLSVLLDPPPLPPWARDEARVTRGRAVFADRGLYQSAAGLRQAMWLAGHPEARSSLLEAADLARSCGRADLVVAAALAGDRGFFSVTAATDHERIELLTEAARLASPDDLRTRALLAVHQLFDRPFEEEHTRRLEEMLDDGTLPTATRVDRSRAGGRPTRWFPLPRAVDPEARALEAFRLEDNVEAR